MRADEARIALDEWTQTALQAERLDLPASLHGSICSDIPEGSRWAVVDARTLWALGPDDVLRSLSLDADGQITSTSRPLAASAITVSHSTEPVEFYGGNETMQRHHWRFSIDGSELVALTGLVYGERGYPRDRPDRRQLLAIDLQEVAARSDG
jgi:hypothetical protein